MPDEYVTKGEYLEYAKRIDEKYKSQDRRIEMLESTVSDLAKLPFLVEQIKENQERQLKASDTLAAKFEEFERRPVNTINNAKQSLINTICNTLATLIVGGLGAIIVLGLAK